MSSFSQSFCKVEASGTKGDPKELSANCAWYSLIIRWGSGSPICATWQIYMLTHEQTRRWPKKNIITLVYFVQLTLLVDFSGSDLLMGRWALPSDSVSIFSDTHITWLSGMHGTWAPDSHAAFISDTNVVWLSATHEILSFETHVSNGNGNGSGVLVRWGRWLSSLWKWGSRWMELSPLQGWLA